MFHRSDDFSAVFRALQIFQDSKLSYSASLRFPLCISQHLCHHLLKAVYSPDSPASPAPSTPAEIDVQSCEQWPTWLSQGMGLPRIDRLFFWAALHMAMLSVAFSCFPCSTTACSMALPKAFGNSGHWHVPRLARANGVADSPVHSHFLTRGIQWSFRASAKAKFSAGRWLQHSHYSLWVYK